MSRDLNSSSSNEHTDANSQDSTDMETNANDANRDSKLSNQDSQNGNI